MNEYFFDNDTGSVYKRIRENTRFKYFGSFAEYQITSRMSEQAQYDRLES